MGWLDTSVRWLVYGVATICVFAGLAIGVGALDSENTIGVLYFFVGWFPVVVVHELGHAIVAALAGWRVWIFHAAPIALRPRPFGVYFVGNMGGPDTGGLVFALPRSTGADTWRRQLWISAGGPLASWLMAALCFRYAGFARDRPDELSYLATALGLYSFAAALLTTWPIRRARANDGAKIVDLFRQQPTANPASGVWHARRLWSMGVPQSQIEPWMREACETSDCLAFVLFTRMLDALARGDEAEVRAQAQALSDRAPDSAEMIVAQGFIAAWYDADISRADSWLARAPELEDEDVLCVRQLALATIFRLEGDVSAAEKAADSVRYNAWHRWRLHNSTMDHFSRLSMTRPLPAPASARDDRASSVSTSSH